LKGKFFWNKRTGESLKQAADFYQQAIEKDPNYALAYSGLAETYVLFSSYDVASGKRQHASGESGGCRALEIDDSLAEAHTALAFYLSNYEWAAVKLLSELRQEATRGYVQSYTFALMYIGFGDKEEALNWLDKHMSSRAETANTFAVAPELDNPRSQPRFKEMLKRMNLQE
jgi:tetratricopeptide (TPR) repeat protein